MAIQSVRKLLSGNPLSQNVVVAFRNVAVIELPIKAAQPKRAMGVFFLLDRQPDLERPVAPDFEPAESLA